MDYQPELWQNYFAAQAGAAAALAGLVFVAVSLNLKIILRYPHLPGRVGRALISLVQLLLAAMVVLVPHQSSQAAGTELLILGMAVLTALLAMQWRGVQRIQARRGVSREARLLKAQIITTSQLVSLPTTIAGATLLAKAGGGLAWLALGTFLALIIALADAWVLLIEIQR
jgi:hypothetical protein